MVRIVKLKYMLALLLFAALVSIVSIVIRTYYQPGSDEVVQNEFVDVLKFDPTLKSAPVLTERAVELPRDFAFHNGLQHEWWNYFANLEDKAGNKYFVHWSYFRHSVGGHSDSLGWRNSQIYSSHVEIATTKRVWKEQRLARGGIGQAGLNSTPFRLWIDNWAWRSLGKTVVPGHLDIKTDTFALSLYSNNRGSIILPGQNGYQIKSSSQSLATYNIQAPFLSVYGQLQLTKGDGPVSVEGEAWMSKEWGNGLVSDNETGWDWFVINLDSTTRLSIKRMRYESGLPYLFGTISHPDGKNISLSNDDISITPLNNIELDNGRIVPMEWRIIIPEHGIDLKISSDSQERWLPFATPYWQGAVHTTGSHIAQGYMQLVGY